MKKILGTMVFVFSLILGQNALANWACGDRITHMVESMSLDATQKEKIKPILEQLKTVAQEKGTQMRDISKQIKEQMISGNMDQNTVNTLVDKKAQLIGDLMKAKINAKSQILSILNDKQKAQLLAMMQTAEEKIAEKFKNCHDE